ncbi:MAG: DUF6531 domain-containing protein, partial [Parachlamydiaceae bacterium]
FKLTNESTDSYTWWNNSLWAAPITTQWKADVRPEHKSAWDMVADPVDIVTGAFYVDEVDLNLPGPFPLEIRRNYNSQNPLPGIFGFGWKLSLNPYLFEEENKIFVSEQDGTIIVYRRDDSQNRWIVLPEDNPDLRNFNQQGMGSIANPFHAYIEKRDDYILYGTDGSERIFRDNLLRTWSDHAGNTLTFSYEDELLKRIESSSGGFLCFDYNHGGKIAKAYAKDGRRIIYTYDSQGNLATVKLPNDAVISYDYDRFHRIIRESKPHGRVLENVYKDNKVVEQRSPVGLQQNIITSAAFTYADAVTTVTDAAGGCTEYKIYNKQIYKITDPEGHQTLQSWFLDSHTYFDAKTEQIQQWNQFGGYPRSLKTSVDKRGLSTNHLYDSRGNIAEITLSGNDLTGKGDTYVSKHFSYDANDLCIQEETLNTKTLTTYDSISPYLPKRIERYADNTLISFIDLEYIAHGMVSKKNESGAITLFEYDDRDFPIRKIQETGTNDPDVITNFRYNNQGQCVELITDDSIQRNEYDITGNCYRSTMSLPSGKIVSQTHAGYDLNNELIWKQGDDPNNTLFLDYNAAGLLKASRKDLSQFNGSSMEPASIAYTLYEYDACGRLIQEVDPLGNCTYCENDLLGRVSHSTKHGLTTTFTYEAGGLVASVTTPSGVAATRSYTTNGLLKSEMLPDGTENSYIYDFMGRPIQEIRQGMTSTIRYDDAAYEEKRSQGELTEVRRFDARGNLISLTDRAGFTWTKTYDLLNRIKTEITSNGDTTNWNYQGDTIVCTLPSGEKTVQRYEAGALAESKTLDSNGTLIAQSNYKIYPAQSMTEETHGDIVMTTWINTLGLPVSIQQGSKVTTHHYDACGNCVLSVDGEGNITYQEFDPLRRLTQKKLPDGALITYDYDADSNLIAYHMPGDLTWKADYDSVGHKCAEWQEMDGEAFQRWEYSYTNGLLSQAKDPLNRLHQYTYDIHSRLTEEHVENYSRTYTYDPRDLLSSVTESGKDISKVERSYDKSGRLIHEIISLNGITIQNTKQDWTPSSRSLQIGNHHRAFHYQGGRLQALTSNSINLSYDYTLSGSLIKKTTPFSSVGIQYNDYALPQAINVQLQGSTYSESFQWTSSGKLASYDSTYPETRSTAYNYTARGYLKSAQDNSYTFDFDKPGRGILTAAPNLEITSEGLDKFERIIKESADSKIRNIAYDLMGQVIAHGNQRLSWDPWGRLSAVTSDTYEWTACYDALGRRLRTNYTPIFKGRIWDSKGKTVVTTSYYDPEQEFQEIGISYEKTTFWKMHRGTTCEAIIDSTGEIAILHHDIRNNLTAAISSQTSHWNKDYPTPGPPSSETPDLISYALSLTWQSKRVDPTGLIWLGARYYDPNGGRFLNPDPVSHPSCLDLYAYANGDPINNIDLDGRFATSAYKEVKATAVTSATYFGVKQRETNIAMTYVVGQFSLPNKRVVYTNGMNTPLEDALEAASKLSEYAGGHHVHLVYNDTYSLFSDVRRWYESCKNWVKTGVVSQLHSECNDFFATTSPNDTLLLLGFSEGVTNDRNFLDSYDKNLRQRIEVVVYCPSTIIDDSLCKSIVHYCSERDVVHTLVGEGIKRGKENIVFLPRHRKAPYIDHKATSPTFKKVLTEKIQKYLNQ